MFPKLKIVTTEIDKAVDDNFQVVPGVCVCGWVCVCVCGHCCVPALYA